MDFHVAPLQQTSVLYVYSERDLLDMDPPYQRPSEIWPLYKRQLLVDSIINGFDIPKIYFHEYVKPKKTGGGIKRFAIVDGKQRLDSIWKFIDNEFPLSDDFEYLRDSKVKAAGLTYGDLATKYPRLKMQFDATSLPIIAIQTDDVEIVEEMFSRLNESMPLTAPEKRNAFGGPMPKAIRALAEHDFFTRCVPYENKRYRHYELATKFLFFEHHDGIADTKKPFLDALVRSYKQKPAAATERLARMVRERLTALAAVFETDDRLLRSQGDTLLYYLIQKDLQEHKAKKAIKRSSYEAFEKKRRTNRDVAETDISKANFDLLEYDNLSQSTNHVNAISFRYHVLAKALGVKPNIEVVSDPLAGIGDGAV